MIHHVVGAANEIPVPKTVTHRFGEGINRGDWRRKWRIQPSESFLEKANVLQATLDASSQEISLAGQPSKLERKRKHVRHSFVETCPFHTPLHC